MGSELRELWFTEARGLPVTTADGNAVGRLADLAAQGADDHPAITHVVFARRRGEAEHVGWDSVAAFDDRHGVRLVPDAVIAPGPFSPPLLLGRDVLDAQVVDALARRLGLPVAHRAAATMIDWSDVHLTGAHDLRLGMRAAQLHRLPAAELSELVAPSRGRAALSASAACSGPRSSAPSTATGSCGCWRSPRGR